MKRLLRCFLLCLAVFALPFQSAAAVMMVGTAAQEAGVGVSMASHHAAVLMETRASLTSAHDAGTAPHCHKAAKAAPDGAADAGKAPLPR